MLAKILAGGFALLFMGFLFIFLGGLIFWITSAIDKINSNMALERQLNAPRIMSADFGIARDEVIRLRKLDDEERRERLQRARAEVVWKSRRWTTLEKNNGAAPEPNGPQAEVDVTAELFDTKRYLICKDPLENPTFFYCVLLGRSVETGIRQPRFHYTPIRAFGRQFLHYEAQQQLRELPDNKKLFIVPVELAESERALTDLRKRFVMAQTKEIIARVLEENDFKVRLRSKLQPQSKEVTCDE